MGLDGLHELEVIAQTDRVWITDDIRLSLGDISTTDGRQQTLPSQGGGA